MDQAGRCAHWRRPVDRVSFRFPCCDGYWACHDCHDAVADHPATRWSREDFGTVAVLCGGCFAELTITAYLASPDRCPRCGAGFNPRCVGHHPRYFDVDGAR